MAKKKQQSKKRTTVGAVEKAAPPGLWDWLWDDYVKWCERKGLKP